MYRHLKGTVNLPGSKSESNRALMIAAYGGFPLEVTGLSDAHDTVLLRQRLEELPSHPYRETVVDGEDAGTVARFLMTFLACREGTWLLTGTERLCQRPMRPLVEALRQLSADIQYVAEEGFLPVRIQGVEIQGGRVAVDASQSSQFVSSLLLAAPMWKEGLVLHLGPQVASTSYIDMTVAMMRQFGAEVQVEDRTITVRPRAYRPVPFVVSPDWSAASYWYEMAAMSDDCDLLLKGLSTAGIQGDAVVAEWYQALGVETFSEAAGVRLRKASSEVVAPLSFDFTHHPDLFPALFVTCVALGIPAHFHGIANLSQKESNRVESLVAELLKVYHFEYIVNSNDIIINKSSFYPADDNEIIFNTFHDHRIAMSLACLLLKINRLSFDHPEVVAKSYPDFWKDLLLLK